MIRLICLITTVAILPIVFGQTCSVNQTLVNCNVRCPSDFCPRNDRPQPICDPPNPCPGGCRCKINYRIDNRSGNCIFARECPAIRCTRPNEVYNSCPSDCLAESCEDRDLPPAVCNNIIENCQPKCICRDNFFRNANGICVAYAQCP